MPELPDVASFKKYFDKYGLKRKITSVDVKRLTIVREIPAGEIERELTGRSFLSTRQHGKYLFAELDSGKWLVVHFGMTGYLEYFEKNEDDPKYDRLLIRFEGGGFLAYVNQRMIGWVGLTNDPNDIVTQKGIGPSALDPQLDYEEFKKRFAGRKGEIKPALMDQAILAGIGNVYSDEILFQARTHPKAKISDLSEGQLKKIYDDTKAVLRTAVRKNADTETFPETYLLRYRRKGAKCPACGGELKTIKVGGRTAYFCPKCQPRQE